MGDAHSGRDRGSGGRCRRRPGRTARGLARGRGGRVVEQGDLGRHLGRRRRAGRRAELGRPGRPALPRVPGVQDPAIGTRAGPHGACPAYRLSRLPIAPVSKGAAEQCD
ncbi:hypothetical protein NOCARDAX2BIS_250003 [Nocardioides sp. AX2bis]|nr:hypothetical protein NOCARDAX2BIS_250003 [Nocardioides sp. AX2bis]